MNRKKLKIVSAVVSLNLVLAYGVMPLLETGMFYDSSSVVHAASGVIYEVENETLIISGEGTVSRNDVLDAIKDKAVKNVVISGDGIKAIGALAFRQLRSIESVALSESIEKIGEYAFEECISLKSINMPEGLQTISKLAFNGCSGLRSLKFPDSLNTIGSLSFVNCSGLSSVEFAGSSLPDQIASSSFDSLKTNGAVCLNNKRILITNESDESYVEKLVSAGIPESWFSKFTLTEENFNGFFNIVFPENLKKDGNVKEVTIESNKGLPASKTLKLSYKKDGSTVTDPTELGVYEVYVTIDASDENYNACSLKIGEFEIVADTYKVIISSVSNGVVLAGKQKYGKGEEVILSVSPDENYFTISVSYNDGTEHIINPVDGVYSFTMPEKVVTVNAVFEKPDAVAAVPATCTETGTKAYWTLGGKAYENASCTKEIKKLETWKVVQKKAHDYTEVNSKPATCTSKGSKTEKCTGCGDEKTTEYAAKGHSFGEWTLTKEATETEPGTETRKCSSCDAEETRETALKAHEHKAGEPVVIPASCTKDGSKVVKCASCGETLSTEKIAKTGHTEGEWSVKTAATCTLDGIRELKCAVCAAVIDTEAIPAAGHKPGKFEVKTAATCTADGEAVQKCTACGEELDTKKIEAAGHKAGEFEVKTAATCTADGEKVQKCTVCKEVVDTKKIEATGHRAGEFEVKTAATCTADGEKVQKCTSCGETLSAEKITKTGHSFGDWKAVKEPTETETGLKARTCSACKETEEQEMAVLVHTHTPGAFEVKTAATCTADGEEVQKCTSCGEVLDVKKIEAAGHKAGEFEVKTAATCETDGVNVQKCTVCGEVLETETVSKTGHRFGEWTVTAEPTETEAGVKTRVCDVCKKTETETVAALGHTHKPGAYETVPATCTADGKSVQKCLGCGEVLDEKVIKSEGHKWNTEATVDKAATCTEEGGRSVHCSVCGETKDKEVIPAEGHSFGDWKVNELHTSTDAGTQIRACEKCGTEEIREYPPFTVELENNIAQVNPEGNEYEIVKPVVEHKYSEWKVTKEPTWSSQGEQSRVCADCDNVQTRPYGEAGITTVKKAVVKVIRKLKSFFR